jgi:hypothetical protein
MTTQKTQIKCDGFSVSFKDNMMHLDLVTLSKTAKDDKGRPMVEITTEVVMTPDALFRSLAMFQKMMKMAMERGKARMEATAKTANGKAKDDAAAQPQAAN